MRAMVVGRGTGWLPGLVAGCILAGACLAPGAGAQAADPARTLLFGIEPYADAATILRQYSHLAGYLNQQGYAVEVQTAPDAQSFLTRTMEGRYEVVLMPPHFLALAQAEAGYVPIVRLGVDVVPALFVRENDPMRSLYDLRGHTVGVPGELSYIALSLDIALRKAGLEPGKDLIVEDKLSHPNTLLQLAAGKIDAAATVQLMVALMQPRLGPPLRQLGEVGKPMSLAYGVRGDLGSERIEKLRALLMAFPDSREGRDFANPVTGLRHRLVSPGDFSMDDPVVQELLHHLNRK